MCTIFDHKATSQKCSPIKSRKMKFILEQSLLEIIQVNVSNFVLFDEILKIRTLIQPFWKERAKQGRRS